MTDWQTQPQSAEGFLWVCKPRVVFEARVNLAVATYPLAVIPFDGVTTGAYTDLEMGMTLVLGTTPGAWDLGHTYVRGDAVHACATSTTINVGYSSQGRRPGEVDAQDNAYLTVLDLFEVWKRPSKGGSAPQSILKDYAISPHNQHLPVIHCGSSGGLGVLDFVDGGGVLELDFDASGSRSTNPTDPGWFFEQWDVKDGAITAGTDTDAAITVEFPPGYRWIKRDGMDNDLRQGLPRRFCVVALEASGVNAPLATAYRIRWTRKVDGQTLTASLSERLDPADYPPGTVVMLLVKETFAGAAGSVTGWTTKFAGWLDTNAGTGQAALKSTTRGTTITAVDIAGRLKQLRAFPSRLERVAGLTDNSNAITAATIWRYIWWALVWHTSAPMLSDIDLGITEGDDTPFSLFSSGGGSFYAVCDTLAKATGRRFTCDSRGRLRVVVDPLRQEAADRTSTVQAAITEADWTGITRMAKRPPVGVLKGAATPLSTTPAASLLTPLEDVYAIAPGLVEGAGSGEEQLGYPSLADEATFLKRIGQDYARRNNREDMLRIGLAHGNDAGIEPALMQWVTVTASAENIGWLDETLEAARCLPDAVEFVLDDDAGALTQSVTVERETVGTPGTRDPSAGIVVVRPVIRPPVIRPVSRAGFVLKGGTGRLGAIATDGYLYYTLNGGWSWGRISLGLTGTLLDFVSDPWSPLYIDAGTDVWLHLLTTTRVAKVEWNAVTRLLTAFSNNETHSTAVNGRIEMERATRDLIVAVYTATGGANSVVRSTDGTTWGSPVTINASGGGNYGASGLYLSGKTANRVYVGENQADTNVGGRVSSDGAATFGALSSPNLASKGSCFGLHVPWNQPGEGIAYFGSGDGSGARKLMRVNGGGSPVDISPQDGGESWGAQLPRSIDSYPLDRRMMAACLRNGDSPGGAGDVFRLYYTTDEWATKLYIAALSSDVFGRYLSSVRLAGDSPVGWAFGSAGSLLKFDFSGNVEDWSIPGSFSPGWLLNIFGF